MVTKGICKFVEGHAGVRLDVLILDVDQTFGGFGENSEKRGLSGVGLPPVFSRSRA